MTSRRGLRRALRARRSHPQDASGLGRTRLIGEHFKVNGEPKRPFETRRSAETWIAAHPNQKIRAYKCSFCSKYHLATIK
jgi:hypothetical protein